MWLCRGYQTFPLAHCSLFSAIDICLKLEYSNWEQQRYNWTPQEERVPVAHPVLESLKVHHADNFGWALACCAWHRDLAEDVLQESYLRVLDGRAEFSAKSSLQTWFFAVIKRVAADVQRTQKRHQILNFRMVKNEGEVTGAAAGEQRNSPGDAIHRSETSRQLQQALMQISQRQREVLHLAFYAELTLEEVAETLGVSVGSVRTHYHRGKEQIVKLLTVNETNEH